MEHKNLICCFTGHRSIPREHLERLPALLEQTLESLIQRSITVYRAGGAKGFDTLAALTVLEKKRIYPQVCLHLILPCRDQARGWSVRDRQLYEQILAQADEVTYVRETYSPGCMHERNRRLVDGSHCCVGYCISDTGGSAYTLDYANRQGLRVINLGGLLT